MEPYPISPYPAVSACRRGVLSSGTITADSADFLEIYSVGFLLCFLSPDIRFSLSRSDEIAFISNLFGIWKLWQCSKTQALHREAVAVQWKPGTSHGSCGSAVEARHFTWKLWQCSESQTLHMEAVQCKARTLHMEAVAVQ